MPEFQNPFFQKKKLISVEEGVLRLPPNGYDPASSLSKPWTGNQEWWIEHQIGVQETVLLVNRAFVHQKRGFFDENGKNDAFAF